jgi:Flp pilus assembly protein CpaB
MVTATDIGPGEVLAAGMFVSQATSMSGLANRLDAGHTALAVTVDSTRAVGGWLRPGDRVNILVPSSCPEGATLSSGVADGDVEVKCRRVRYLYQAVAVLAVGAESVPVAADSGAVLPQPGAATLVLSLPPRAAQWVASYDNDLWFTLVHPQYQPRDIGPLPLFVDRLPGENPALLTPECGDPDDPVQAGNAASGVDGSGNQCVAPPALGLAP